MDDRREQNRRRLAELAAEHSRRRAAAESAIARKEVALASARADLARLDDANTQLEAQLDALKAAADEEPIEPSEA